MLDRISLRRIWFAVTALFVLASVSQGQEPFYKGIKPFGESYVYKSVAGRDLHLYVGGSSASGAAPKAAFVVFHGGGFKLGGPQMFNPQSRYLVDRGLVSVEVEYRFLDDHTTIEDCIKDARSAVRWVRAHSTSLGIDPSKIIVGGGSAGGYLAAAVAFLVGPDADSDDHAVSTVPNALVLYNPALDGEPGSPLYKTLGEKYVALSPYLHIPRSSPPVLIMSGAADTVVGVDDIRDFRRRLARAGIRAELLLYPKANHGFFNYGSYVDETNYRVELFLRTLGWVTNRTVGEHKPLSQGLEPEVIR